MKGQASIELVGIVGIALVLATPFVVEAQGSMIDLATSSEDANFQISLNNLEEKVDKVAASGEKSRASIDIQVPSNIESVSVQDQAIIFTQNRGERRKNFTATFETEINTSDVPVDQGIYQMDIEYLNDTAQISRIEN